MHETLQLFNRFAFRGPYAFRQRASVGMAAAARRLIEPGEVSTARQIVPRCANHTRASGGRCISEGYTLIELLVVMAAIGLLLSIAAPRYTEHVDRARETVLRHNLAGIREAIDKFYADRARYPKDLKELVSEHYLRQLPVDPVTDRDDSWLLIAPEGQQGNAVRDIRSGAGGNSREGAAYASW